MSLVQWFTDLDEIDERYTAILNELRKERDALKRHLKEYPDSKDNDPATKNNGSLDPDAVIDTIDKKMLEAKWIGLLNILIGWWTEEHGNTVPKLPLQLNAISDVINDLGYPPLCVPYGGVSKIREICLSKYSSLFSKDAFKHVWKAGKKTDPQRWEVENVEKYKNN